MPPSAARLKWQALVTALKTTVKHFTSKKYPRDWDLGFHIQFEVLRALDAVTIQWSIEDLQSFSMNYLSEPKGGWVIPVSIDVSDSEKVFFESELRKILEQLGPGLEIPDITAASVQGEWQGGEDAKIGPNIKEEFNRLSKDIEDGPVILSIHGGAFITGSAAMERSATFKLARMSKGRVFAVDYRLAPQNPFPAALIDTIIAYKYLIDPPPGALHKAVDPSRLLIAGDSVGGGLAISLMTFLQYSKCFPLPAGLLALCPMLDGTGSFPSTRVDTGLDWLPCLWKTPYNPVPSKLWPPAKPRFDFYSDIPLHPLISPVVIAGELPPCPPMLIIVGEYELLRDETLYFAKNYTKTGGKTRLQMYRSMPHAFVLFEKHRSTQRCYVELAKFAVDVTTNQPIETRMEVINGKGITEDQPLNLESYPIAFTKEELISRMEEVVTAKHAKQQKNSA